MDLIKDLWRGDIPLVKTYWLFGVVAGIFFKIAFAYIKYQGTFFIYSAWGHICTWYIFFYFCLRHFYIFRDMEERQ